MTTIYELAGLQGLPRGALERMLSTGQGTANVGAAIGDAMSINVLMRILPRAMEAAGLLDGSIQDIWKGAAKVSGRTPDALYALKGCLAKLES